MKRSDRYIDIEYINLRTLENLRNDLSLRTIYTKLDTNEHSDPNHKCEIPLNILTKCKNKHMPNFFLKFNKRKDKREAWMTDGLLQLVNTKNDLYVDWKKNLKTLNIYNEKNTF